jgi:hypothetical protein
MSATETNLLTKKLLAEIPKRWPTQVRIWRNNRVKTMAAGENGRLRMIDAGIDGQGDISGIAGPRGRRLEIEVKTGKDKLSEDQKRFRQMILSLGGIYIEARSVDGCIAQLEQHIGVPKHEARGADIERGGRSGRPARPRAQGDVKPGPPFFTDFGGPSGTP